MKYCGPGGGDKQGRLVFFTVDPAMIQDADIENGCKKEAQITVHKFGRGAERRVEMNIMAYRIAVTRVQNLRQTVKL